jgi:hypothetical protein
MCENRMATCQLAGEGVHWPKKAVQQFVSDSAIFMLHLVNSICNILYLLF